MRQDARHSLCLAPEIAFETRACIRHPHLYATPEIVFEHSALLLTAVLPTKVGIQVLQASDVQANCDPAHGKRCTAFRLREREAMLRETLAPTFIGAAEFLSLSANWMVFSRVFLLVGLRGLFHPTTGSIHNSQLLLAMNEP